MHCEVTDTIPCVEGRVPPRLAAPAEEQVVADVVPSESAVVEVNCAARAVIQNVCPDLARTGKRMEVTRSSLAVAVGVQTARNALEIVCGTAQCSALTALTQSAQLRGCDLVSPHCGRDKLAQWRHLVSAQALAASPSTRCEGSGE